MINCPSCVYADFETGKCKRLLIRLPHLCPYAEEKEKKPMLDVDSIYPLTVTMDRYTGSYSGGKWTAWNLEPSEIPVEVFEDDVSCGNFWFLNEGRIKVGMGETPNEAIEDLRRKINDP